MHGTQIIFTTLPNKETSQKEWFNWVNCLSHKASQEWSCQSTVDTLGQLCVPVLPKAVVLHEHQIIIWKKDLWRRICDALTWGHILLKRRILSSLFLGFGRQASFQRTPQKTCNLSLEHKTRRPVLDSHSEWSKPRLLEVLVCINLYACPVFLSKVWSLLIRNRPHLRLNSGGSMFGSADTTIWWKRWTPREQLEGHPLLPYVAQDVARTFRREIESTEVRWEVLPWKDLKRGMAWILG